MRLDFICLDTELISPTGQKSLQKAPSGEVSPYCAKAHTKTSVGLRDAFS
jgi:hypothetical protein